MEKKLSPLGAKRRSMRCSIVRAVRKAVRSVRVSKYRRKNHVKTMTTSSHRNTDEWLSGSSSDVGYFSREYKGHARMPIFVAGGGACTGYAGHSSSQSSH